MNPKSLKHLVLWRLKDDAPPGAAMEIKTLLESLAGEVEGLVHIEVGENIVASPAASHLALYCELVDEAALQRYQEYPRHAAMKERIGTLTSERRVVDYWS